jgi:hypothetical protein
MDEVTPNPAILYGRDHEFVGRIGAVSEGRLAIALSRGGAPKTYHYKHPNEDAAAFGAGPGGWLLVVADAHGGRGASEIAVDHLVEACAPVWTATAPPADDWSDLVRRTIGDVHLEILESVARGAIPTSRTTLAFALIRPDQDRISVGAIGDSHAFRITADAAVDLARAPDITAAYLGGPADTEDSLTPNILAQTSPLAGVRAVMLLSDGLSERGIGVESPEDSVLAAGARAARAAPDLRPLAAVRGALEDALAAHVANRAGDNVAAAVVWLEP